MDADTRHRLLSAFALAEHDREFYASFRSLVGDRKDVCVHYWATLSLLTVILQQAAVDTPTTQLVIHHLQQLPVEDLERANCAIYDGTYLVLPVCDGDDPLVYDIRTLEPVDLVFEALTGSLFFVGNICCRVSDVLHQNSTDT